MNVFVTGASGWLGSALVPELLGAGHEVVGLARSDASAQRLEAAGATVRRGDLDDPDGLRDAAKSADGVIHLAFRHDLLYAGDMAGAAIEDRRAIEVLGEALAGSDRALVIASGVFGIAPGRMVTEQDGVEAAKGNGGPIEGASDRMANAHYTAALASRGVRSCVVRLPPTCHSDGDNGFMSILVGVARDKGVSGYVGDGSARWPATHRLDVARAFRLAVEKAPAGSTLHAVGEEGVRGRDFAEVVGRKLDIPVVSVAPEDALDHFGFLGFLLPVDSPASSEHTREVLGWEPTGPSLLEDLEQDYYYRHG
ncbi:MAG: SDR family oxidoreductase [Candidatus Dormibacteraeota bacterium]|uniref:SDR family oxidoreductase n=1 Tax=Candidatus Amunia macphersoniae TaxID=3127014 RepID=A0A934N9Q5_9BACT|nr:SDR family oxidoreductase [Candidatus Dormibacteraeota bacterium]